MNYGLMIAVGLVVICFIAMVMSDTVSKEGFVVSQYVSRAKDSDPMFSQTMPNGVYTNKALNLNMTVLNKALDQPDLYLAKSPSVDYSSLFQEDPEGLFQAQDEQFCQGVTNPRNLPDRGLARVGCGWVYFADPAKPSKGAIGTSKGPIFSAGNNGQWIWDLQLAAQMEDIKQCRKLTACENVDGNNFTEVCGFCPDSGHGVPINSQGAQRYPDDTTGGSCASMPIRTASQCVVPSTDSMDSLPSGGGNFLGSNDPNVCAVNSNGTISAACVIRQAQQAGMSVGGAFLLHAVNPQSTYSETETEAFAILRQAGYMLPASPYKVDPITALNQCSAVVKAQVSGSNPQIRGAAALLSAGVAFNVCDIDPTTTGPFKPACVQQEFRKAGCQPAGAEFPATSDKASAASLGKTMAQVRSAYSTLFGNMSSSNGTVADKAVKDCLGIKVSRPAGSPCDSAWIEQASKSEGFIGTAIEGFAAQQQTFLLQSHNYPSHLMRSMGAGAQAAMVVGKGTGSVFVLTPGATPGTVQLQPQALPGTSLSPISNAALNTMSEAPSAMNSFRVVPGLADKNKVSFQSVADPAKYIRHAGFILWAHRNDGSPLFGADATFQPMDVNARAITLQLPAVSMYGWKGLAIDGAKTISVGTDNTIWYTREGSTGMMNGAAAQMMDRTAPFKLVVDGASANKAVSVGTDGVLYSLNANRRWAPVKTIGPPVVNASIAADGTIGYLNNVNEIFRGSPGNFKKLPGSAFGISLGKSGNDIYVVGTDYSLYIWREGRNTGNDSWENIPNPPGGVRFRQIVVSKDGFKVAAVSQNGKLYGLDVYNKWSEIPNPVGVAYVGLNKNDIVGTTGPSVYKKSLQLTEGFATSQAVNGYVKSLGKYPQSDTNIVCFSKKGIEEAKNDCKNNLDCAGFSYAKNGSSGCFKKGPLSGTQTDSLYDGFTKDPMPKFNPRASLPGSFMPRKGAVLGDVKVAENYRLSFSVTPKGLVNNWSSIIHFTISGKDCCDGVDRSPAIFFFPGSLMLHVRIGDMTNGNWGVDVNGCAPNRTSKVVLECRNSVVKVSVDNNTSTLVQPSKRASGPAKVYGGVTFYLPANAQIDNLSYEYL